MISLALPSFLMFGFFHRMQFYKSRATLLSFEAQTRPRIGLLFHSILHQSVSCLAPPLAHLLLWSWVSLISKYVHINNTAAEAVLVEGRRSAAYLPGKKQCEEVSVAVEFVKAPSLVFSRCDLVKIRSVASSNCRGRCECEVWCFDRSDECFDVPGLVEKVGYV